MEAEAIMPSIPHIDSNSLTFRLDKPHLNCLETTVEPPFNLKFYFLPFSEEPVFHSLKLAAVEEEVFSPLSPDRPKATVCNYPPNCALWHSRPSAKSSWLGYRQSTYACLTSCV
jgi:hypothetical protein